LSHGISEYAHKVGLTDRNWYYNFVEDDITCGLAAVLSIWHPAPEFEGSLCYKITNPELEDAVFHPTLDAIEQFAEMHPDQIQHIVEKCVRNKVLRFQRRYIEPRRFS
jgi:DNA gyrase subunit B